MVVGVEMVQLQVFFGVSVLQVQGIDVGMLLVDDWCVVGDCLDLFVWLLDGLVIVFVVDLYVVVEVDVVVDFGLFEFLGIVEIQLGFGLFLLLVVGQYLVEQVMFVVDVIVMCGNVEVGYVFYEVCCQVFEVVVVECCVWFQGNDLLQVDVQFGKGLVGFFEQFEVVEVVQ